MTLQRTKKKFCPLCRDDVILEADTDSIDSELSKFLKKYFPKEVREKQILHETADGIERFGSTYVHPSQEKGPCAVM
jgi:E3 ubiquitin-protein ligase BAH